MKATKALFCMSLSSLMLFAACGNPHVNVKSSDRIRLPSITEPVTTKGELMPPQMSSDKGNLVELTTKLPEASKEIQIVNPNPEEDLLISYAVEKGDNFRLKLGDCVELLAATKSCKPEVIFFSTAPGIYQDNLIITYSSKSNPAEAKNILIPLRGERLVDVIVPVIPTDINLSVKSVDFGKSLVDQALSQMIEVRNPTEHKIALISKTSNGAEFDIGKNGTCKKVIAPNSKCSLEVIFNSSVTGLSSRIITITYASILGGAEKEVTAQLLGEKVKDLNDCAGKPCGEPLNPGKLDFSSLNGQPLDFGVVGLNSKTKQTIPLFNTGDLPVEIESVSIEGAGFELISDCPASLLPGFCNLEVSFLPTAEKSYGAIITAKTKDGQILKVSVTGTGKEMLKCFKKTVHHVSAQAEYDISKVVLPYMNSSSQTTAKIYNLYGTKVNSLVKSLNRYTVKDSQVVTTFLIPALTGKVDTVEFTLNTSKVILDGHEDTEAVCLSSNTIKKCSGKDFDTSFIKLKNTKFWKEHATPVNDLYEATLLKDQYKCGSYTCANMKKTFSANKLFELSDAELMSVLKDKVVSLVVTDDTRNMSLPSLLITTSEEIACKK